MKRLGMWFDIVIILVVCSLGMALLARHFHTTMSPCPSETPSKSPTQTTSPVSTLTPSNQPIHKTAERIDDIMETVFHYQLELDPDVPKSYVEVFFLSQPGNEPIEPIPDAPKSHVIPYPSLESGKDPSDSFMKRFAGYSKQIKKLSQSTKVTPKRSGWQIVDKKTGAPGIILRIDGITWINNNEVKVQGGYDQHWLAGSLSVYHVVCVKDNHWEVKKKKMLLIR